MPRTAEAGLIVAASGLATLGVVLVGLAAGTGFDARAGLTFLMFLIAFGGLHLAIRQTAPNANTLLLPLAALLSAIGLTVVYRLDPARAGLQRWWLLIAAALSIGLLLLVRKNGLALLRRYRYIFLLAAIALLLLPLLPSNGPLPLQGFEQNGSRLWVRLVLGPLTLQFQPGEIAKLLLVVFLASFLAERAPALAEGSRRLGPLTLPELRQLVPVLAAWAASFAVLVYQRDLGASLLLFGVFVAMLYVATGRAMYVLGGVGLALGGAVVAWAAFDHVQRRVTAWLDPFADYADSGYQIAQSLFAMASGSLSGAGLGLGRPDLIPNASTDFVFAAIGEELGLAGTAATLAAFALLVGIGFGISLRSRDPFRKLLAAGLAVTLGLQTFLIIGGVVRLLPLTGLALPFVSYGGSSLVSSLLLVTLLARISHEERLG